MVFHTFKQRAPFLERFVYLQVLKFSTAVGVFTWAYLLQVNRMYMMKSFLNPMINPMIFRFGGLCRADLGTAVVCGQGWNRRVGSDLQSLGDPDHRAAT